MWLNSMYNTFGSNNHINNICNSNSQSYDPFSSIFCLSPNKRHSNLFYGTNMPNNDKKSKSDKKNHSSSNGSPSSSKKKSSSRPIMEKGW